MTKTRPAQSTILIVSGTLIMLTSIGAATVASPVLVAVSVALWGLWGFMVGRAIG